MRGYYGYDPYWAVVGQARQSASELFKIIQRSMPVQESTAIRTLAAQFNAARHAEQRYGGLSGNQLDSERNPKFPRRLVVWYGQSRDRPAQADEPAVFGQGFAMQPVGVYEGVGGGEVMGGAFAAQSKNSPNLFYGLGFERVAEPWLIILPDQYTP